MKRIAVFRALNLGDMLCFVPALKILRDNFKNSQITLISLPWAQEFAARFQRYIDKFMEFPGFPGLPEQKYIKFTILSFLKKVQGKGFDLSLQMHGDGRITNGLVMLFGSKTTAGFYLPGNNCPDPKTFFPYPVKVSEVNKNIFLLKKLGLRTYESQLEFPLTNKDFKKASIFGLKAHTYVCIHPGSVSSRPWSPHKFAVIADNCFERGFKVILTGTAGERSIINKVREYMKYPSMDLSGKTDLGTLAALIKSCRLLVCNDTGVSHLADALGVPSIVIFTDSDPDIWAPKNRILHRVIRAYI